MMKKIAYFAGGAVVAASMATIATSLDVPHSFEKDQTISSTEMNANFAAVKAAVDDNDDRINKNDTRITSLETAATAACPDDMVAVGALLCVDKYEASVWDAATDGTQIDATACAADGSDCTGLYARSAAGVLPATNITWFQAQQACANVGKRLLTNAEWQLAVAGTDGANCNINGSGVANTDANTNVDPNLSCESRWGVVNMVGNVNEWVADWAGVAGSFGDTNTTANPPTPAGAVYRGGGQGGGNPFAYNAVEEPLFAGSAHGFRCAR